MEQSCANWLVLFWNDLKSVDWLEWARILFDLLKGIAWPLAVFMLVWIFRQQIRERIRDLISAGPTGAVFQPAQAIQPTPVGALNNSEHPMHVVNELIEKIRSEVDNLQDQARIPALIKSLAEARIETKFENIFGAIFQSQIEFLRALNDKSLTILETSNYFEARVKPVNLELFTEWGFTGWSRFLFLTELVVEEGEQLHISPTGKDFLLFVDTRKGQLTKSN